MEKKKVCWKKIKQKKILSYQTSRGVISARNGLGTFFGGNRFDGKLFPTRLFCEKHNYYYYYHNGSPTTSSYTVFDFHVNRSVVNCNKSPRTRTFSSGDQ